MTPKNVGIWIVEDQQGDAMAAFQAIKSVLKAGQHYRVFWDRTLQWSAELTGPPLDESQAQFCKEDHMPDIVVLDLLDKDGGFAAGRFYEKLRKVEVDSTLPAAFVIVWSVKTGLPEVQQFLDNSLMTDRRLVFTSSKTPQELEKHLLRCIDAWHEAQLL